MSPVEDNREAGSGEAPTSSTLLAAPAVPMPESLKKRLYPVVLELFSKNDFHEVNIRDICKESRVAASTIYRYHPSKEALLFAILDEKIGALTPLVREHLMGLDNTKEVIRKIFWVTLDYYDRNQGLAVTAFITVPMRAWMRQSAYAQRDAYEILAEVRTEGLRRGDLDPAISISRLADIYYMFCHRYIQRWHYQGGQGKLTAFVPVIVEMVWKLVSK